MDLQYQRLDLALLDGDDARIQNVLEKIASISNGRDNPSYKLASAFAILYKAERSEANDRARLLSQATELLMSLESTRKEWSRLYLAQAKIADLQGKSELAIAKYALAVEKGERQPEVISRLFALCYNAKKNDVWSKIVQIYPPAGNLQAGGETRQIEMLLQAHDFKRAMEIARKFVPENTTAPEKLYYLAHVLIIGGDAAGAETALRNAHRAAPKNAAIWYALVEFLYSHKKGAEARQLIEDSKDKLDPAEAHFYEAQAYRLVGDNSKSKELYEKLLKERPNELLVLRAVGSFYFGTGNIAEATRLMKQIIQHPNRTPNDEDYARRTLALCTVVNGDHNSGVEALKILGFGSPTLAATFKGTETIEDLRSRFAIVSVIRGRDARVASVKILEEIERRWKDQFTLDEQLAFGRLQFLLGDWSDATRRLLAATNATTERPEATAVAIGMYANILLQIPDLEGAKRQIDRLLADEKERNALRTVELYARWAMMSNKKSQAADIMAKYAATKDAKPEAVAAVLEQLGLPGDAEVYYRRAAEKDAGLRMTYAQFLSANGRLGEARLSLIKHGRMCRRPSPCRCFAWPCCTPTRNANRPPWPAPATSSRPSRTATRN